MINTKTINKLIVSGYDKLESLVQVKHYETTMNIGWMNTIIESSQIIECNNC